MAILAVASSIAAVRYIVVSALNLCFVAFLIEG